MTVESNCQSNCNVAEDLLCLTLTRGYHSLDRNHQHDLEHAVSLEGAETQLIDDLHGHLRSKDEAPCNDTSSN